MMQRKIEMTYRTLSYLFALLLLSGCVAKTPTGPPKPKLDSTSFNFGRIPTNTVITHTYRLTNEGGDSVVIEKLRTHCGCTKAPLSDSVVGPGEMVPIELRFNARGYRGQTTKSASITYRFGEDIKTERLSFNATADTTTPAFQTGELGATPPIAEFTDSAKEVELWLTNRVATEREVVIVDYQSDRIKLPWKSKKIGPKETVKITIKRLVPAEGLVASITLEMSGRPNTRITIPVREYSAQSRPTVHTKPSSPKPVKPLTPWQM